MFQNQPPAEPAAIAVNNNQVQSTGRQQQVRPTSNSDVFRHDGSSAADTPNRGGRRRYEQEKSVAPFACGPDERNGTETPRSAGGRRRFEERQQKQAAPFAVDGESVENSTPGSEAGVVAPYANDN